MSEEYLDRAQVSDLAIDQRHLCPPKRLPTASRRLDPDLQEPAFQQSGVVPGVETVAITAPRGEQVVAELCSALADPDQHAVARALCHLELNGRSRLLLDDLRPAADSATAQQIADAELNQITALEFAVTARSNSARSRA